MRQPKRDAEAIIASGNEGYLGLWRETICEQGKQVSDFIAKFAAGGRRKTRWDTLTVASNTNVQ